MKYFFFALLIVSALYSNAQSPLRKSNDIYWKWPSYKMDGRNINAKTLKQEIYKCPVSIPYFKKAAASKILTYSFAISCVVFASLSNTGADRAHTGFTIASVASGGAVLVYLFRYKKNIKQAVRLRNRAITDR